jgi:hypothetical protein
MKTEKIEKNYILAYKCRKMSRVPKSFPYAGAVQVLDAWTTNSSYEKMTGFIKDALELGATHIFWIPAGATQGTLVPISKS